MSEPVQLRRKSTSLPTGLRLAATTGRVTKKARESDAKGRRASARLLDPENIVAGLTKQQGAVAKLVAQGLTNPEIAARLHLSPHTVRNYLSRVMARLGVHNRTAVAVILTQLQSQHASMPFEENTPALARPPRSKQFAVTIAGGGQGYDEDSTVRQGAVVMWRRQYDSPGCPHSLGKSSAAETG